MPPYWGFVVLYFKQLSLQMNFLEHRLFFELRAFRTCCQPLHDFKAFCKCLFKGDYLFWWYLIPGPLSLLKLLANYKAAVKLKWLINVSKILGTNYRTRYFVLVSFIWKNILFKGGEKRCHLIVEIHYHFPLNCC